MQGNDMMSIDSRFETLFNDQLDNIMCLEGRAKLFKTVLLEATLMSNLYLSH